MTRKPGVEALSEGLLDSLGLCAFRSERLDGDGASERLDQPRLVTRAGEEGRLHAAANEWPDNAECDDLQRQHDQDDQRQQGADGQEGDDIDDRKDRIENQPRDRAGQKVADGADFVDAGEHLADLPSL